MKMFLFFKQMDFSIQINIVQNIFNENIMDDGRLMQGWIISLSDSALS